MPRKPNSGVKSRIKPKQEFTDMRHTLRYHSREWRIVRLHELSLIPPEKRDARQQHEIAALWAAYRADHERAVLDNEADWFDRQAKAMRDGDARSDTEKARDRFDAAVARELEMSFWETRAKQPRGETAVSDIVVPLTDAPLTDAMRKAAGVKAERRKRVDHKGLAELDRYLTTSKGRAEQGRKQRKLARDLTEKGYVWLKIHRLMREPQLRLRKKNPHLEDATLAPAGKRAGITARQVLGRLHVETVTRRKKIEGRGDATLKQSKQSTYVIVEGCRFESKRRACDAITKIAAQLYGWDLPV